MTSSQFIFFALITFVFSVCIIVMLIRYAFRKDEQDLREANSVIRRSRKPDADVVGYNALFGE